VKALRYLLLLKAVIMPGRTRAFAPQTRDAAEVLGAQIAEARRARRWTAEELAERLGVSRRTVSNLERGVPTVTLGVAFEAATLLGISLFGADGPQLARLARQGRERLALLPSRVRPSRGPVDDDF
jgi:transcriptional regulator with XRE-family HTH domain